MIVTSCFFLTVFRKQDRHIAEVFLKDCFVGAAKQTNLMASRRLPRQFCARIKLKSETWGSGQREATLCLRRSSLPIPGASRRNCKMQPLEIKCK